jgi:hypothetical protein
MIKKVFIGALQSGALNGEELYNLDDQSLFALMGNRSSPLFPLALQVKEGALFTLAAEFPFDQHYPLRNIADRARHEAALAAELSTMLGEKISGEELIIDVPEPFSLETGLYVRNEERCFAQSSSAFKPDTARSFVESLYVIRVFVHPRHEAAIKAQGNLDGVLQLGEKWLK